MSKNDMYNDLVKCKIFNAIDIEKDDEKVFENDIIVNSEYANVNKKYKIENNNMTNEEVIIALLAKQTLYIKTIKNVIIFIGVLAFLSIIILG